MSYRKVNDYVLPTLLKPTKNSEKCGMNTSTKNIGS